MYAPHDSARNTTIAVGLPSAFAAHIAISFLPLPCATAGALVLPRLPLV
jgi:hypothetical protein